MAKFVIELVVSLGMLLWVVLLFREAFALFLSGALSKRRRKEERQALSQANRHSCLATDALRRGNIEAYEYHLEQGSKLMDRALGLRQRQEDI